VTALPLSAAVPKRTAAPSLALAALSLSMLLSSLGTSIANVALPSMATAFGAAFQDVQWIVLAYLLTITALIVSAGRLGDLIGRRRLLLSGIALFTFASAACGAAPTLPLLIAARAVQGIGAAVMTALTMAFAGDAVPKEKTGSAMGLLGTMSAAGTALGPSLGGLLIATANWRAIFLLNLPLGLVAMVLAWRALPEDRASEARARFDVPGTLLLVATLTAYALAMTIGRGRFSAINAALLAIAIAGIALFALVETKVASPLIRPAMLRNRQLSAGLGMNAIVTTVMMATLVVGPFYLSGALRLDAARVGLVMTCGPLVSALTGVPAGRIVDRRGKFAMIVAGLLAMLAGSASLALSPATFGAAGYIVPMVLLTAGYALFQAANNTAVMTAAGAEQKGVVSGMLNLSRNAGLITGASVMGAVFALGSGAAGVTAAGAEAGMHATFAVAAMLIVLALTISFGARSLQSRA
jgi:EmrB/QacA subfamily drug resistance transporter